MQGPAGRRHRAARVPRSRPPPRRRPRRVSPGRSQRPSSSSKRRPDSRARASVPLTAGDRRRVVVEGVRPRIEGGAYAAKATANLPLAVSATLFADGTAPIVAWVGHGPRGGARPCAELPLRALGQDRFAGWITPAATGWWEFSVWGAVDDFGAWLRDTRIRLEAGQDVGLDLADGADLARKRAGRADIDDRDRERLL